MTWKYPKKKSSWRRELNESLPVEIMTKKNVKIIQKAIKLSFSFRRFLRKPLEHEAAPTALCHHKCIVSELMNRKENGAGPRMSIKNVFYLRPKVHETLWCFNMSTWCKEKTDFSVEKTAPIGRAVRRKWQWFMSVNWSVNLRLFLGAKNYFFSQLSRLMRGETRHDWFFWADPLKCYQINH